MFIAMIISLTLVFSKEWAPRVSSGSSSFHSPSAEMAPMTDVENTGTPSTAPASPEVLHSSERSAKRIKVRHSDHEDSTAILVLDADYDFITMHNILYFLYTGCVNLHFGTVPDQNIPGYPEKSDAFNLFCAADFYCLQPLRDRCFRLLMDTRTPDNIYTRLFDKRCEPYKDLQEQYITFLLEHFDEVKVKDGWRSLFDWGEELIAEEQKYRGEVFFEICKRLSFAKPV
jgi:hypothetical protein